GIVGEAPLVKGSLMQSVMYHNANSAGQSYSMPPLAKSLVDEYGMAVFAAWIEALGNGTADKPSPVGCAGPDGGGAAGVDTGGAAGAGAGAGGAVGDDASVLPPPDGQSGGGGEAGSHRGPTDPPDASGCSCRVGHAGAKPTWLGSLLLGAA